MEKRNNRLLAILCSLIGGLIGTIPFILSYVFLDRIVYLLVVVIILLSWQGYTFGSKKINSPEAITIVLISIFSLTICSFVIIPFILLLTEYHTASIESFKLLYTSKEFVTALKVDFFKSMLFLVFGIFALYNTIKD